MEEGSLSALAGSADYVSGALLGAAATPVAVLAMAGVGMMLLMGRLSGRRALLVVVGCFVLFSAPTIAGGLLALTAADTIRPLATAPIAEMPAASPSQQMQYDPYAGAAVPTSREEFFGQEPIR